MAEEPNIKPSLLQNIISKLPYQTIDTSKLISNVNPKYNTFSNSGLSRSEALAKNSVFFNNEYNNIPTGQINSDSNYNKLVYANIDENKGGRLRDYRIMAAFSEVSNALDEICDSCINEDYKGEVVHLTFKNDKDVSGSSKDKIREEFQKFVDNFELKKKGFEYFRQLLIEGEVYFEHIIHKNHVDEGILGAVLLPSELIDPVYDNIQNMLVKGYVLRKPVYDINNPEKIERYEIIPMDQNQITYIHSSTWNQDKTFRLPFIENCRRAYRQLSLIEDAIVIYRLVRAPERLVFNVDVGNMSAPKAEGYLRKLIQEYWSKKTFDTNQSGAVQKFNPQSMMDNFWFPKRAGSEGTSVTTLQGGQNLGELTDLNYFVTKLYESLKVPLNRLNQESQVSSNPSEILREELKFANFIIRLQQEFADGLKNGFVTHLKLKKLDEKFEVNARDFEIDFNVPNNFYELRESQKLELRANNYNTFASSEMISDTYAQKKYLNWTDKEIRANREFMRKDAEMRWELEQIAAGGPNWRETLQNQEGEGGEGEMGGFDMGGGGAPSTGAGPGGTPPDFAGTPPDAGGADMGAEAGGDVGGEPDLE